MYCVPVCPFSPLVATRYSMGFQPRIFEVIPRDLRNELLERKGFAKLNIGYMIRFAREYDAAVILQQAVAKLSVPTNTTATEFLPQAVAKSVNLKQRLMEWAREEDEP